MGRVEPYFQAQRCAPNWALLRHRFSLCLFIGTNFLGLVVRDYFWIQPFKYILNFKISFAVLILSFHTFVEDGTFPVDTLLFFGGYNGKGAEEFVKFLKNC